MAFGEDVVPEKFTVYKPKPRARAPDPEVDRFDECMSMVLPYYQIVYYFT